MEANLLRLAKLYCYLERENLWDFYFQKLNGICYDQSLDFTRVKGASDDNHYNDAYIYEHSRVYLNPFHGSEQYVNASYIQTTATPYMIICQSPFLNTMDEFCAMIWIHNVQAVISFATMREVESNIVFNYWDFKKFKYPSKIFSLKLKNKVCRNGVVSSFTEIKHRKSKEKKTFYHYFYEYRNEEKQLVQIDRMVEFLRETRSLFLNHQSTLTLGSLIVHCSCGSEKSGIYALVCNVLRELYEPSNDYFVDVFDLLIKLRRSRPMLVTNSKDFRFAYLVVLRYMGVDFEYFNEAENYLSIEDSKNNSKNPME